MQQTEHYKLNRWERTDRIQMEDFNNDNAKIEAALTEQAAALGERPNWEEMAAAQLWVKLGEITLNEASTAMAVTVPDVEQYRHILLAYAAAGSNVGYLRWNGNESTIVYTVDGFDVAQSVGELRFTTCGGGMMWHHAAYTWNASNTKLYQGTDFLGSLAMNGAVTLGLVSAWGSYAPGSTLAVYGLKK